jgi:hypothetical protein
LFLKGLGYELKCVVCQGLLNKITAETCSPKCHEQLRKNRGADSISKMRQSLRTKHGVDNPAFYSQIGMSFVHNTPLNYWYIDGDKRIYRYKLRKQPTDPQDKTERELCSQQGWNRIWDCGNAKYEWRKQDSQDTS